jgi:riboflavin biosynthesis pyrimidine reductase
VLSFDEFCELKTREAESAVLTPLETIDDRSTDLNVGQLGNDWSRRLYGGMFHLVEPLPVTVPSVSVVFVQSRDGNTGADNPADLGGGPVDQHVIYEGLSRVAADAVLAGAKTASGKRGFFSVWHPAVVALRESLGLPRHPAQVIVTGTGCLDMDRTMLFNAPNVPVYVLCTPRGCDSLVQAAVRRPSVQFIPMTSQSLRAPLEYLRQACGIRRVSAIGGRTTASTLIDENLVQDLCLTTTALEAGEPNTPLYVGKHRSPETRLIVRKRGTDPQYPILFEHLAVIGNP